MKFKQVQIPKNPELEAVVPGFEDELTRVLRKTPDAVLDSAVFGSRLHIPEETALDILILFEKGEMLQTKLFWECSNGMGTASEADRASQFPTLLECDRCGEVHEYDQDCISVHFVATDALLTSINSESNQSD